SRDVAGQAAGIERSELLRVVSMLRAARLVRTSGAESLEPYHDRTREALDSRLSAEGRAASSRAIAVALEASGSGEPELLASHWREAGENRRGGVELVRAANRAAAALAFDRAARRYREALSLDAASADEARRWQVGLGEALGNAGRGAEAARAYLAAVDGATAAEALDIQRRAAEQLLRAGHIDEGVETLARVLRGIGMSMPPTRRRAVASLLLR